MEKIAGVWEIEISCISTKCNRGNLKIESWNGKYKRAKQRKSQLNREIAIVIQPFRTKTQSTKKKVQIIKGKYPR